MATIVRTTCNSCGDVELAPANILLRICSHAPASTYRFTCPSCDQLIEKAADDDRIIRLLTSVDVPTVCWSLPAELLESREGPAFTADDVIDFHLQLESPEWFERLSNIIPAF